MKQKPVAWMSIQEGIFSPSFKYLFSETKKEGFIPLYTAPRELSDEEILELTPWKKFPYESFVEYTIDDVVDFARAILKKASEK